MKKKTTLILAAVAVLFVVGLVVFPVEPPAAAPSAPAVSAPADDAFEPLSREQQPPSEEWAALGYAGPLIVSVRALAAEPDVDAIAARVLRETDTTHATVVKVFVYRTGQEKGRDQAAAAFTWTRAEELRRDY